MRAFDRVLSVLVAAALLLGGVTLTAEIVHTFLGGTGYLVVPWQDLAAWGRAHSWSDAGVLIIGGAVAFVGLALLLAELRPRRPALLVLTPRTDGVTAAVGRAGLRRALAARADDVDGVRGATARLGRRRAVVTAVTTLREPGDLDRRVDEAVTDRMAGLGLVDTPAVRVRVKRKVSS